MRIYAFVGAIMLLSLKSFSAEIGGFGDGKPGIAFKSDVTSREAGMSGVAFKGNVGAQYIWKAVRINETSSRAYAKASAAIGKRFEVYGKLGAARLSSNVSMESWLYKTNFGVSSSPSQLWAKPNISNESGFDGFLGGAGAKAIFYDKDGITFGADAQWLYQRTNGYPFASYSVTSSISQYEKLDIAKTKTQEAQIALLISRQRGDFAPYAGVKYSWYQSKYSANYSFAATGQASYSNAFDFTVKGDDLPGIFVGVYYKLAKHLSANIEARAVDEKAYALSITYNF